MPDSATCTETANSVGVPPREKLFRFPFGYRAKIVRRRQRIARNIVFRDEGFVWIEEADQGELETAYRVDEQPFLRKRRRFDVFRHRGRLWWPAFHRYWREQSDERRSLIDALDGTINLFGENLFRADAPTVEQVFVREFVSSDRDRVYAQMQRKAKDYLVVGERLFVACGVPIVILEASSPRIVCTGAARPGEIADPELSSIEAWGHAEYLADSGICSETCWTPGLQPPRKQMLRLCRAGARISTVEEVLPEDLDLFQLRVDAAFRIFRCRLFDRVSLADGGSSKALGPFFERAHPHDAPHLTRRRITAISRSLALFGTDWFLQRLGTSTMQCILGLMEVAAGSPELSPEEDPLADLPEQLSAEDEAALQHL